MSVLADLSVLRLLISEMDFHVRERKTQALL